MKNLLNKRVSVKSIMLILLAAVLSFSVIGAVSERIQAMLTPDIIIRYDGEVQTLRDANGNVVHPITYQGTTYLPLRAVSNMLGVRVEWEGANRTVWLGRTSAEGKSLVAAGTRHRDTHPYWTAIQGAENLPQKTDDFGNPLNTHTAGYRQAPVNAHAWRLVISLSERHSDLSLTWAVTGNDSGTYRAEVYNADTDVVLSTVDVQMNGIVDVSSVNISGVERLGFRVVRIEGRSEATGWVLNPVIK